MLFDTVAKCLNANPVESIGCFFDAIRRYVERKFGVLRNFSRRFLLSYYSLNHKESVKGDNKDLSVSVNLYFFTIFFMLNLRFVT